MVLFNFLLQLQLASVVIAYFSSNFMLNLLKTTENYFNFTNVPIFLEHTINSSDVIETSQIINQILQKTQYIFTADLQKSPTNEAPLRDYIQENTLSLVFCQSAESKIWHILDVRLRALRQSKILVLLDGGKSNNTTVIGRIFTKLWQLQFLYALVITENAVYRYEPYPEVKIFQLNLTLEKPFRTVSTFILCEIYCAIEL